MIILCLQYLFLSLSFICVIKVSESRFLGTSVIKERKLNRRRLFFYLAVVWSHVFYQSVYNWYLSGSCYIRSELARWFNRRRAVSNQSCSDAKTRTCNLRFYNNIWLNTVLILSVMYFCLFKMYFNMSKVIHSRIIFNCIYTIILFTYVYTWGAHSPVRHS